jgi:anthranilate phosphoribosyltransferase
MIRQAVEKLTQRADLAGAEMELVMEEILTGACPDGEIVAFLTALRDKGETVAEVSAAARVMRAHAVPIRCDKPIVLDTCGTGGDRKNTFNVSTAAAFVAAGCGVTVAKHGNRSVSSRCGSADILEALGVTISLSRDKVERCLNQIGIAFLYAPDFHPAMKFAAQARRQIGTRTIFNILGPLCNPAKATHQLVGVFSPGAGPVIAAVSGALGTLHCVAVHGEGVMDEVTTAGWTEINEFRSGSVRTYTIHPDDFGLARSRIDELTGGEPAENAAMMLDILGGKRGPKYDVVIFNAAAALYAADAAGSIREGIAMAAAAVDSGAAMKKLEQLREYSHGEGHS